MVTCSHAILAGGGLLPQVVIDHLLKQPDVQGVLVMTFTSQPQPEGLEQFAEQVTVVTHPLGAAGKTIKLLKQYDVQTVVLAGHLHKPSLLDLKPDATGLGLLAKLARRHDNDYLTLVEEVLTKEGFAVAGAHEICPDLCPDAVALQALSKRRPSKAALDDIALGVDVLTHMAPLDIGQACVVKDGVVLGVEGVEGTDALLERCAALRQGRTGGVLVKLPKHGQTEKADLPTIGVRTFEVLMAHGYDGVAVAAGKTLVLVDAVPKDVFLHPVVL